MQTMRNLVITLAVILAFVPIMSGQDLSKYRTFSLGTSLAALSKQVGQDVRQADVIHQSPALIQELTDWSLGASRSSAGVDTVSQIVFSFYNGKLYRMVVTYDDHATEGLTEDDMVNAISARYGTGIKLYPEISLPRNDTYDPQDKIIAQWDDSSDSVSLFRSSGLNSYGLTLFSKQLDAQAKSAIAQSDRLDKQEAPQKEIDQKQQEVDDLEAARQKNMKAF